MHIPYIYNKLEMDKYFVVVILLPNIKCILCDNRYIDTSI